MGRANDGNSLPKNCPLISMNFLKPKEPNKGKERKIINKNNDGGISVLLLIIINTKIIERRKNKIEYIYKGSEKIKLKTMGLKIIYTKLKMIIMYRSAENIIKYLLSINIFSELK